MKMKLLLLLSFSITYFFGLSQSKFSLEATSSISIPFTSDKINKYYSQENNFTLNYESRKKHSNPSLNFRVLGEYSIADNFRAGLQTGINLYFNEKHFIGVERTYVGVPIQLSTTYLTKIKSSNSLAINIAGGVMAHKKIDDFVFQVKGISYLYNTNVSYHFAKKHIIRVGWEHQREQVSFLFNRVNSTSNEVFKFPLKRNQVTLGYGFKLK